MPRELTLLSWNLFHGRAVPDAGHPLGGAFAAALAGWEWDLALLQEVPPWWPQRLAHATGAVAWRAVRTARCEPLAPRRAVAARRPERLGSWGGGANAILARTPLHGHARARLAWRPERRWVHGAALADGTWVANLHASTHPEARRQADLRIARDAALGWAAGAPLIFGGDLNVTRPHLDGLQLTASHHVDHVLARGWRAARPAATLDAGRLSDHRPLRVTLERNATGQSAS